MILLAMRALPRSAPLLYVGVILRLLVGSLSPGFGQPALPAFTAPDYERLIERYRQGDASGAARALGWVPLEELEPALEALQAQAQEPSFVKAAILLHTEAGWWQEEAAVAQLRLARSWMGQLDPSERSSFERRWYSLLSCYALRALNWEDRLVMEAAVAAFPEDLSLQLALGVSYEATGWMQRSPPLLKQAERRYRAILESSPQWTEVRIRLARVHHLLGRDEEALGELSNVLPLAEDPSLRLAVLLCHGDIYEKRHEMNKALRSFRAAWELDPSCQMATIALSHALEAAGRSQEALHLIERFFYGEGQRPLRVQGRPDATDLWWRYALGPSYRFRSLLESLRGEVRP